MSENHAPVAGVAPPDQSAAEDEAFVFVLPADTFTDEDAGDTLTYSATLADGSALPSWLVFDAATRTFSGTPANGDVGSLSIRVTATDAAGASASTSFTIDVANVNDTPVVAAPPSDQPATEDEAFVFVLPAETFTDEDAGDTLTYSATLADGSALPSWLVFDAATRTFSGTPANGDVGSLSIRVTATDAAGASASTTFAIEVANVNDAPVVAAPPSDQAATEDEAFSFVLPAETFTDEDAGDTLTYSAALADGSALPSCLVFDSATRTFSGTPANGDVGSLSIQVTATDAAGASASTSFAIDVANVNDAPTVGNAPPDRATTEDGAFVFVLPADTFADDDAGDTLTYSATLAVGSALPSWLVFDAATRTFSGTPADGDAGSLSIQVTATDSVGASASTTFGLEILDPRGLTYSDAKAIIASAPQIQIVLPEYLGGTADNAYLKSYVTSLMCEYYGISDEVFAEATVASTTLIRDFLNRALLYQDNRTSRASLDADGLMIAPAIEDVASLLRYPAVGQCGNHNLQLYQIYRAFGFDTAWVDSVNSVGPYTYSHATTIVRVEDLGKWIVQDSYENFLFVDEHGEVLSYEESRILASEQSGPTFGGLDSFLDYPYTGEGRPITVVNQELMGQAIFSLPYNLVYSIDGLQYLYGTSQMFADYPAAYDPAAWQGGTFSDQASALAAIESLRVSSLSWQAAANALRTDYHVTGFMLNAGTDDATVWLTVRLDGGEYISVNYVSGEVLPGTFEQLVFGASVGLLANGDSFEAADFLGGFRVITASGYAGSDWEGRAALAQNQAPDLEVVRQYDEAGQAVPLTDLFRIVDQDGDTPSMILVELDGGSSLVSAKWGTVDSGFRFIPVQEFGDWGIVLGDASAGPSIFLRATDGISWTGAVAAEIGVTGSVVDSEQRYDWATMTWHEYASQREREYYQLDNGEVREVEYDSTGKFDWTAVTTERDVGDRVVSVRTAFDTGGSADLIEVAVGYVLRAGDLVGTLKTLDPASTDALDLTGNAFANSLEGNAGANILDGGGGGDRLAGLAGDDRYIVRDAADEIVEAADEGEDIVEAAVSYALAADVSIERLRAADAASTDALDLTGNEFANSIEGNAGANILDGGGGDDLLHGYGGNDIYHVDSGADRVFEAAGGGNDTIITSTGYTLAAGQEIELLRTHDSATTTAVKLIGNGFANTLMGNNGNNYLNGGAGADRMTGYLGDDWYVVDHGGDAVTELGGEGFDAIQTSVDYRLQAGQSIEWLGTWEVTTTTNLRLTGNEIANRLVGNNGNNYLDGGAGADRMAGYLGDDWYVVDNAGDAVTELAGEGFDAIQTNVDYVLQAGQSIEWLGTWGVATTANLRLTGNETNNRLVGNAGENVLDGKRGTDLLYGYGGADTFAFTTALGSGNVDRIADFQVGLDKIALDDAVFGALALGALSPSAFRTGATAQDADDRILYDPTTGALYFDADGAGGVAAVQFASLGANMNLNASDFVLI
jgi:Ca2+-binding RTX toxin-like protein